MTEGEFGSWGCVATCTVGDVSVDLDESSRQPFYKLIVSTLQSYLVLTLAEHELKSLGNYLSDRIGEHWQATDHVAGTPLTFVYDDEFSDRLWLKIHASGAMIAEIKFIGPTLANFLTCVASVVDKV